MEAGCVTQRRLPALYRSWDNLLSRLKSTDGGELKSKRACPGSVGPDSGIPFQSTAAGLDQLQPGQAAAPVPPPSGHGPAASPVSALALSSTPETLAGGDDILPWRTLGSINQREYATMAGTNPTQPHGRRRR
jgi:hypothetical protein